jgi:multidrug efflux pump subunit AcrB
MVAFIVLVGVAGVLYNRLPTGFLPEEDQGYALVIVQLPPSANMERTGGVLRQMDEIIQRHPAVDKVLDVGYTVSVECSLRGASVLAHPLAKRLHQRWLRIGCISESDRRCIRALRMSVLNPKNPYRAIVRVFYRVRVELAPVVFSLRWKAAHSLDR